MSSNKEMMVTISMLLSREYNNMTLLHFYLEIFLQAIVIVVIVLFS